MENPAATGLEKKAAFAAAFRYLKNRISDFHEPASAFELVVACNFLGAGRLA
jgi:hypothetical protein